MLHIVGQRLGFRRLRDDALSPWIGESFVAENSNDNDRLSQREMSTPDAHGQAALFLIESLIHALVARSVISVTEAVEIVEVAAEVKVDLAADIGDTPEALQRSLDLLEAIRDSLAIDAS
jgi:hypothetical protein